MKLEGKASGLSHSIFCFALVLMSFLLTACFFEVTSVTAPSSAITGSVITFTVNATSTTDDSTNRGGIVLEIPAGTRVLRAHYVFAGGGSSSSQDSGDLTEDPSIMSGYTSEPGYQLWGGSAPNAGTNDENSTITLKVWLAVPGGTRGVTSGNYRIKAAVGAYDGTTNSWVPQSPSAGGTPVMDFSSIGGNYQSGLIDITEGSADGIAPDDVTPIVTASGNDLRIDFSSYDEAAQGGVAGYRIYVSRSSSDAAYAAGAQLLDGASRPLVTVSGDFHSDIAASGVSHFEVPPGSAYPVTVQGLSENTPYYFAVTAADLSGNESLPVVVSGEIVTGAISGTVSDGIAGIAGLWVSVYDSATNLSVGGVNTDAFGHYTVTGLPSGNYNVNFCSTCSGLAYVDQWYDNVTVTAPGTTGGVDALLFKGGSITGSVTSDGITGIADVSVYIYDSSTGEYVAYALTDSGGNYTVTALPSGSYKVLFDGQYVGYWQVWYNGVVAVAQPETVSGIDAILKKSFSLATTLGGNGNGRISSSPSGIDCSGGGGSCNADFNAGSVVDLSAAPADMCTHFSKWTGYCVGNGSSCSVTMNGDISVEAVFDITKGVIIDGNEANSYSLIQKAYGKASNGSVLEATAGTYGETLLMDGSNNITLKGGFDCNYHSNAGAFSVVQGSVTIKGTGRVTVENIEIQ